MNITAADLKRKLYIYSIFTEFKFFSLNRETDDYLSCVRGSIEMESKDEEIKIIFNWMATGGTKSYEDAFNFNIDIYNCENSLEIEGRALVDEDGWPLNKSKTIDTLMSFLTENSEWQSKIKATLPVAITLGE